MQFRLNVPPLTRVLLVLLVGLSLTYQAAYYRYHGQSSPRVGVFPPSQQGLPWIALTPQLSLFYPWTYVTSTFAEHNLVTLAIAGATIFYGGKYLERAWGSTDFGKFILVVVLVPNFVAALLYVLVFAITRNASQAFPLIHGSISIQAAFLVAFKQLVPEHTVTILSGLVKVRVKHFPAIFLIANTISGVVFFTDTAAVLSWLGFMSGWIYLRFYKPQPDLAGTGTGNSQIRGDASETFAFAYFWPDVVHGPVAALSDAVFNVLVALRLCTPFSAEAVESSNQQASARGGEGLPNIMDSAARRGGGGSASKREEAERRRALALKALDERLQAAAASRQAPPPPPSQQPPLPLHSAQSSAAAQQQASSTSEGAAGDGIKTEGAA